MRATTYRCWCKRVMRADGIRGRVGGSCRFDVTTAIGYGDGSMANRQDCPLHEFRVVRKRLRRLCLLCQWLDDGSGLVFVRWGGGQIAAGREVRRRKAERPLLGNIGRSRARREVSRVVGGNVRSPKRRTHPFDPELPFALRESGRSSVD